MSYLPCSVRTGPVQLQVDSDRKSLNFVEDQDVIYLTLHFEGKSVEAQKPYLNGCSAVVIPMTIK